jgi:thioredoxin 1
MNKRIYSLIITMLLMGYSQAQEKQPVIALSPTEFSGKLQEMQRPVIIDVRTPAEFEKGHLEHAVNINWNGKGFDSLVAPFNRSEPVFVYCLSGGRSHSAPEKMRSLGFTTIYEMQGGLLQWRSSKLPEAGAVIAMKGLTLEQYEKLLQSDKLVLVDFYAEWCGPCKKMKPYLEKIEKEMSDKVVLVRIDSDDNPDLCNQLRVTALPTLKLYKNKKVRWESVGYVDEKRVRKVLN